MVIVSKENNVGAWALLSGVVLALAVGVVGTIFEKNFVLVILLVIGLIVGFSFLNITGKDLNTFLMAAISLVIVSFAGAEVSNDIRFLSLDIGGMVSSTLGALLVMLIPATIVMAIKTLFSVTQK
jgi:hypothetical protein